MRNLGLDVARSLAISLVLISHGTSFFLSKYFHVSGITYVTGYLGVEIFFVLSGFLIGKILIADVYESGLWRSLLRFYIRRWFRTLPLYFLLVIVLVLLGRQLNWQSLFFLQNFSPRTLNFIPVSWSLSVEEWFYLTVPFLFLITARSVRGNKKILLISICGIIMVLEVLARIYLVLSSDPTWDYGIRKQVFLRMDSLMVGILLAGLQVYYAKIYRSIYSSKFMLTICGAGLFIFGGVFVYVSIQEKTMDHSFFGRTFLFSLISAFCAILIAILESNSWINHVFAKSKWAQMFYFQSVTSYSTYLIHFDIYQYFSRTVKVQSVDKSFELWFFAQIAVTILSCLLYRFYELPMMKLRDRLPNSIAPIAGKSNRIGKKWVQLTTALTLVAGGIWIAYYAVSWIHTFRYEHELKQFVVSDINHSNLNWKGYKLEGKKYKYLTLFLDSQFDHLGREAQYDYAKEILDQYDAKRGQLETAYFRSKVVKDTSDLSELKIETEMGIYTMNRLGIFIVPNGQRFDQFSFSKVVDAFPKTKNF